MVQIDEQELESIVRFLKVLADRSRFRLLALLSEREYTVKELAAELGVSEPTASWHCTMLRQHDMVEMRQAGTSHYYKLKQGGVHSLLKDLKTKAMPEVEIDENSSDFERHVLTTYFQKEGVQEIVTPEGTFHVVQHRLKQIPVQHKKMLVVVRRLVKEFEFGIHYTEREVNDMLKRFHPDCATLRRQMVDNRLMARKNSMYWRLEQSE